MMTSFLRLLIVAISLFAGTVVRSQPAPVIEWQKCIGSNYGEINRCIQPTTDGGYIMAAFSMGSDNGDVMGHHGNASVPDAWVVKMDRYGNTEWQRSLGGNQSEQAAFIIQTPDGGYMLAGSAASSDCGMTGNHGGLDFWIVKLNANGGIVWQKMYGGSRIDDAHSLAASADGGYFVCGLTRSDDGDVTGHHGYVDAWVIKINASGNLLWQKTLGGSNFEDATSVQATPDGGCIVGGATGSGDGDVNGFHGTTGTSLDSWVVKLDNNGNIQWQRALGGTSSESNAYVQLTNGGYIVAAHTNSSDGDVAGNRNSYDAWVVKLDLTGNILWERTYGGSGNENVSYIDNTPDGGYVVTGSNLFIADGDIKCNAGINDVLLMKISETGALEWHKTFGGSKSEQAFFVRSLNDGSFVLAAQADSPEIPGFHTPVSTNTDDDDCWILKLSAPIANTTAPVVTIDPASAVICAGQPAVLTASVLYGGVSPVYQWRKNGLPVGVNSPRYSDGALQVNDVVSCTVTTSNSCEDNSLQGSDAITIKLKSNTALPAVTIRADNIYSCSCAEITARASVSNAGGSPFYQWKVNGINAGNNAPVFSSSQLAAGDVVTCYYTDNNICNSSAPIMSNAITIQSNNGVVPHVSVEASADTVCKGTTVTFTASAVNAGVYPVYRWRVNNTIQGINDRVFTTADLSTGDIVSCTIQTDPLNACMAGMTALSNQITMHVKDMADPTLSITADATTICVGAPIAFTASASQAGDNPVYQWKVNGVHTGTNENTFVSSSFHNGDVVNCTLLADPLFKCATAMQVISGDIVVTVKDGALSKVQITADQQEICKADMVTFTAMADDAGNNPSFQWLLNNTPVADGPATYSSSSLVNGDEVICRVLPGAGACTTAPVFSNSIVLIVKDTPLVYLSPADTIIAAGQQVSIEAFVASGTTSYHWSPADKLTDAASLTPQTIALTETTSFKLMITDDKGCTGSASAIVKVSTGFYMPNAFTPGSDGLNDVFRIPPASTLTLKEFSVYDRQGNKLFTTNNRENGWDGSYMGKRQAPGVYVYYIRAIVNGNDTFSKGSFLLIR